MRGGRDAIEDGGNDVTEKSKANPRNAREQIQFRKLTVYIALSTDRAWL